MNCRLKRANNVTLVIEFAQVKRTLFKIGAYNQVRRAYKDI
ncbi:hypothetical protein VAE151_630258 [Vibrio aestuarianus]|uniref:Transposase n=1 Tax=Vibrio aestuarianus TaxID=28171 RepID=A0ABN8TMD4_9VIBR|nr:hypothetical protein VAE063_1000258 [Vibrio aestuarianus]CAH8220817.1 hypothetical protein VIBAE_B10343 [Vibrio aestuarianus subsp. francensis]CAH8217703.1 hypothetical protein VAE308_1150205 [Vibrio aestuarianus]CAH8222393.1 hypothetical protein VAE055_420259 [Vibrio aestuarianus]CAH8222851.1 hypothetical protein VAE115_370255 [Vibrio aestuarianus]